MSGRWGTRRAAARSGAVAVALLLLVPALPGSPAAASSGDWDARASAQAPLRERGSSADAPGRERSAPSSARPAGARDPSRGPRRTQVAPPRAATPPPAMPQRSPAASAPGRTPPRCSAPRAACAAPAVRPPAVRPVRPRPRPAATARPDATAAPRTGGGFSRALPGGLASLRDAVPSATPVPPAPAGPAAVLQPRRASEVQVLPVVPDRLGTALVPTLREAVSRPVLPLALLAVVVAFLLVQNRIDRRDPKLAVAPVDAEPSLGFGPVYRPDRAGA